MAGQSTSLVDTFENDNEAFKGYEYTFRAEAN